MSKPTPGLWGRDGAYVISKSGEVIAACDSESYFKTLPEAEANAALIVKTINACKKINPSNPQAVADAIPNLVAQLKDGIEIIDGFASALPIGRYLPKALAAWADDVQAALAKVEGKE